MPKRNTKQQMLCKQKDIDRSKFTYFLCTIKGFDEYLDPVDDILDNKLIPTLFGARMPDIPRSMGINVVEENAIAQFKELTNLTKPHVDSVINQEQVMRKMRGGAAPG